MTVMELLQGRHLDCTLDPVLTTVSGVASTKTNMIDYFDRTIPAIGIITTKSFQVEVNPGNREPVICEPEVGCFGNSVGLRNPGMQEALASLVALRKRRTLRAYLNVSLSANSVEDFLILVRAFDSVADLLELNFSCPHAAAGYGSSIGCDPTIAAEYVRRIRAEADLQSPLFVKLTPNVEDIGSIAKAVVAAGADGLVAINTVGPILHLDPVSGKPILQNGLGGKGGCSGRWVYEQAKTSISAVREAVGPDIPIIGMGGVSTGAEAAGLLDCGADAVGIGSAFGMVRQQDWPRYLKTVAGEAADLRRGESDKQDASAAFLQQKRQMAYERHVVCSKEYHGKDTLILVLDGELDCKAGEFAFLWLPGIGEKPFSVAHGSPLTFIVKRRGVFTKALWDLEEGDELYVRGLYGAPLEPLKTSHALLLGGGTGVAVLPSLAKRLADDHTEMTILVGTSESVEEKALLEDSLQVYGDFSCIADEGVPGRVLQRVRTLDLSGDWACYLVGPEPFMAAAARLLLEKHIPMDHIVLSMERMTLCGIGMCGECACGDRLTCRWGTFMPYDYLVEHAPELVGL